MRDSPHNEAHSRARTQGGGMGSRHVQGQREPRMPHGRTQASGAHRAASRTCWLLAPNLVVCSSPTVRSQSRAWRRLWSAWWSGGKPWEQGFPCLGNLGGKERVRGNGPAAARPSPGHAAGVHVGGVRTRLEADDACMLAQYAGPFFVPGCLLDCQHRTRVRALGNTDGVRLGPHH